MFFVIIGKNACSISIQNLRINSEKTFKLNTLLIKSAKMEKKKDKLKTLNRIKISKKKMIYNRNSGDKKTVKTVFYVHSKSNISGSSLFFLFLNTWFSFLFQIKNNWKRINKKMSSFELKTALKWIQDTSRKKKHFSTSKIPFTELHEGGVAK